MNFGSEMVEAKHISGKKYILVYFDSQEQGSRREVHCPSEPPAKWNRQTRKSGCILWCILEQPSKGQ